MNFIDFIIIAIAIIFALHGWRSGLVRSAGSLAAFVLSIVGAFYVMGWASETFNISFTAHPWLTVIAFLIVLSLGSRLASYLVDTLDLIRKTVAIIPFVNLANSFLGAIFGLLQATAFILVFAYLVVTVIPASPFRDASLASTLVTRAIDVETSVGIL